MRKTVPLGHGKGKNALVKETLHLAGRSLLLEQIIKSSCISPQGGKTGISNGEGYPAYGSQPIVSLEETAGSEIVDGNHNEAAAASHRAPMPYKKLDSQSAQGQRKSSEDGAAQDHLGDVAREAQGTNSSTHATCKSTEQVEDTTKTEIQVQDDHDTSDSAGSESVDGSETYVEASTSETWKRKTPSPAMDVSGKPSPTSQQVKKKRKATFLHGPEQGDPGHRVQPIENQISIAATLPH
jgi:hypothetical protein